MPLQQLFIVAVAAMIGLATFRLVRVKLGQTPHPEGKGRLLLALALLALPPIALGPLLEPAATSSWLRGTQWVPLYAIMVAGLTILMWIAALVVRRVAPGRSRQVLLLALIGSEVDPNDVPFDPPVTAKLAESVGLVDRANAVFPRGPQFPVQIHRAGFRFAWDALDNATGVLEGKIADDHRLGLAVASSVKATAADARSRLDTLRRLAVGDGQAWAT